MRPNHHWEGSWSSKQSAFKRPSHEEYCFLAKLGTVTKSDGMLESDDGGTAAGAGGAGSIDVSFHYQHLDNDFEHAQHHHGDWIA